MQHGRQRAVHKTRTAEIMEGVIVRIQAPQDGVPGVTTARGLTCSVTDGIVMAIAAARAQSNAEIGQELRRLRWQQQLYSAANVVLYSPVNFPFASKRRNGQRGCYPARARYKIAAAREQHRVWAGWGQYAEVAVRMLWPVRLKLISEPLLPRRSAALSCSSAADSSSNEPPLFTTHSCHRRRRQPPPPPSMCAAAGRSSTASRGKYRMISVVN
jgi:hypothetical protein